MDDGKKAKMTAGKMISLSLSLSLSLFAHYSFWNMEEQRPVQLFHLSLCMHRNLYCSMYMESGNEKKPEHVSFLFGLIDLTCNEKIEFWRKGADFPDRKKSFIDWLKAFFPPAHLSRKFA